MTLLDYLPVLIQILLAIGMGFGILFASHLFGQKAIAGKIKDSPYECGLAADTKGETRYSLDVNLVGLAKPRDLARKTMKLTVGC